MEIHISISKQTLTLWQGNILLISYPVSTGKNGVGEQMGSEQTPRGKHYIRAKIGADAPLGMAFKGRRPTGEICMHYTKENAPERDWITSRILWLCGREKGKNRLGKVDTFRRYIYIHGTPDWEPMGTPRSHGCIRMRNTDIVELFDLVPSFTSVTIIE
jgi:L,D-transpeptidase YbiS